LQWIVLSPVVRKRSGLRAILKDAGDIVAVPARIPLNDLRFTATFIDDTTGTLAKPAADIAVAMTQRIQM